MYCPKCDMDFVDGITVCSDCGGKLITHEEYEKQLQEAAAKAAEEKRREEEQRQAAEDMINASRNGSGTQFHDRACEQDAISETADGTGGTLSASTGGCCDAGEWTDGAEGGRHASDKPQEYADPASEDPQIAKNRDDIIRKTLDEPSVYVSKASEYEDNKSSAGAFFLVGGILTVVMALVYTGVISLPAAFDSLLTKVMLTVIGVGFLGIGVISSRKAAELKEQAAQEGKLNEELIQWFLDNYTKEQIDQQAQMSAGEDAGEEELALARLAYIQDEILTNHDIGDKTYADSLAEEIYAKIYEG